MVYSLTKMDYHLRNMIYYNSWKIILTLENLLPLFIYFVSYCDE